VGDLGYNVHIRLCMNRLHIPQAALISMTASDINKAKELLKRPYICAQPHWRNEVHTNLQHYSPDALAA